MISIRTPTTATLLASVQRNNGTSGLKPVPLTRRYALYPQRHNTLCLHLPDLLAVIRDHHAGLLLFLSLDFRSGGPGCMILVRFKRPLLNETFPWNFLWAGGDTSLALMQPKPAIVRDTRMRCFGRLAPSRSADLDMQMELGHAWWAHRAVMLWMCR